MKKQLGERQMNGRLNAAISYLLKRGVCQCPIDPTLAVVIARRLSKGLRRASSTVLYRQVETHLEIGYLSVEVELRAAVNNWLYALQGGA